MQVKWNHQKIINPKKAGKERGKKKESVGQIQNKQESGRFKSTVGTITLIVTMDGKVRVNNILSTTTYFKYKDTGEKN